MTTIFFIIAFLALAVLVLSILLDGIFDVLHLDLFDGIFGPVSIAAFFVVFGFSGAWMSGNTDWSNPAIIAIATGLGALVLVPVGFFMRFLEKSESGIVNSSSLVGTVGTVITDIKVGAYGQVRLNHSGHLATLTATASEEIVSPTAVRVVSVTPPSIVHVEPLNPKSGHSDSEAFGE